MNYYSNYIIYFPQSQMYLFSPRTRVKSIEIARKFAYMKSAKNAVLKSPWSDENYVILDYDNYTSP